MEHSLPNKKDFQNEGKTIENTRTTDNDNRTAEEVIRDSRCPLKPEIENQLRLSSKNMGLSHCELLEEFVIQGLESKKFQTEYEQGLQDERCKYFVKPK